MTGLTSFAFIKKKQEDAWGYIDVTYPIGATTLYAEHQDGSSRITPPVLGTGHYVFSVPDSGPWYIYTSRTNPERSTNSLINVYSKGTTIPITLNYSRLPSGFQEVEWYKNNYNGQYMDTHIPLNTTGNIIAKASWPKNSTSSNERYLLTNAYGNYNYPRFVASSNTSGSVQYVMSFPTNTYGSYSTFYLAFTATNALSNLNEYIVQYSIYPNSTTRIQSLDDRTQIATGGTPVTNTSARGTFYLFNPANGSSAWLGKVYEIQIGSYTIVPAKYIYEDNGETYSVAGFYVLGLPATSSITDPNSPFIFGTGVSGALAPELGPDIN